MNKKSSVDDLKIYFEEEDEEDIEIYSKKRIEEFLKEDKLSSK